MIMDSSNKPVVTAAYADNGEHSHWRLINPETGELLWSELPEEDKILYTNNVVKEFPVSYKSYDCFWDGSCEPTNPGGTMGFGALIICEGKETAWSDNLPAKPTNTNNVAEYIAFLMLMRKLEGLKSCQINIFGDSNMVVNQMNGTWKIKDGGYVPYANLCKPLIEKLKADNIVNLSWIPREKNVRADNLSKAHINGKVS